MLRKPHRRLEWGIMGRPTTYTDDIAAEICARLSCGESLTVICKGEGMPAISTVYVWMLKHERFAEAYARAREEQADTLADEITAIADEKPAEVVDDKGTSRTDSGWVTWQKNRIDARKWVAAKLKPRAYGDKVDLTSGGDKVGLAIAIDLGSKA